MIYRFRLRTLIAAVTAIALGFGGSIGANRLMGFPTRSIDETYLVIRALATLPILLVCVIGALIVFDRRTSYPRASRLALSALCVLVAWRFAMPWIYAVFHMSERSLEMHKWFGLLVPVISSLVEATCWALMLAAFVYATRQ